MSMAPKQACSHICRMAALVSVLLLGAAANSLAGTAKQKTCRGCQSLVEMVIPGGKAILDELTIRAEGVAGTADVMPDGDDVLAQLPLATAKMLSRRGMAVAPVRRLKDGEDCEKAIPAELGVAYTGETTLAEPEVWYSFTPGESGLVLIDLSGSAFDTTLSVFDDCEGDLLAYNDDGGDGLTSRLTLSAEAGTTYYILIDGYWGDYGSYALSMESYVPVPGESCLAAVPIELDAVYEGETTDFVPETWYSFAPPESGHYAISLKDSEFDTTLLVYDDCDGQALAYNDDSDDLKSRLTMYMYEGTTYCIAVTSWWGEVGTYRLELTSVTPPAHDTVGQAIPVRVSEPYEGCTDGASCTMAHSECGIYDSRDVWHSFAPSASGFVWITVDGNDFDTSVAIFDEFRGASLACNDDVNDCSFDSRLCVGVEQGKSYLIRIAGYDGSTGSYTLSIEPVVQSPPAAPHSPSPSDGALSVPVTAVLSWDNWDPLPQQAASKNKASHIWVQGIYGQDDRRDEYQVEEPDLLACGDATVVLLDRSSLTMGRHGYELMDEETLDEYVGGLCADEPFADQPTAGLCSGFLVAPDLIVTAGHCEGCEGEVKELAAVFGYVMKDADTAATTFDVDDVYFCQESVASQTGLPDWSVIRLDRPVKNHLPVRIRRTGFIPEQQPLLVIGHPVGLPRKYDSGGIVQDNWMLAYFSANLDTFGGNSGSAVFNLETKEVEGILVFGNGDFTTDWDTGCVRSTVCLDTGCPLWEDSSRITALASLVPSYEIYLGTDPNDLTQVDAAAAAPQYTATDLEPGQTYYWQVITQNAAGPTPGPIWSFTTSQ